LALVGFIFFIYKNHRDKWQDHQTFFIILFVANFWLTTVAGRFLNDLVPQIVIFASMVVVALVEKIDYKQMIRNVKNSVGFTKLKRIRYTHYLGVLFVAFVVIFPNAFTSLDAAIPPEEKAKYFGENYSGYFGTSLGEQYYWADAFLWLSQQDTEIEKPEDRPAFLSWWDYGFYGVSMGEHPVVADNYQDGFYPASNFLTSQSEMEAIAVLIIRLAEGTMKHLPPDGRQIPLSTEAEQVWRKYFPPYNETVNQTFEHLKVPLKKIVLHYPAEDIIHYMNDKKTCPSYDTLIAEEWGNTILRVNGDNAMYHDITKLILKLSEDQIISLYDDMSKATGNDIRYFGIEKRDITDIFGVFTFLSDKSSFGYVTSEDDWYRVSYTDKAGIEYTLSEMQNMTQEEYEDLEISPITINKEPVTLSTVYRLFYGVKTEGNQYIPTYMMKHFYLKYFSPLIAISTFYEGAKIKGKVAVNDIPYLFGLIGYQDEYGLVHDFTTIQYDGTFELLAPSGNASFVILRDNEVVGSYPTTVNITEDQAQRKTPCNAFVPININKSSVDIQISNVTTDGILLTITNQLFGITQEIPNIQNMIYKVQDLLPLTYDFIFKNPLTNETKTEQHFLKPDGNTISISVDGL
jgi:hypothetical protein